MYILQAKKRAGFVVGRCVQSHGVKRALCTLHASSGAWSDAFHRC